MKIRQAKHVKCDTTDEEYILALHNEDTWFDHSYYGKGRDQNDVYEWMQYYTVTDIHVLYDEDFGTFQLTPIETAN